MILQETSACSQILLAVAHDRHGHVSITFHFWPDRIASKPLHRQDICEGSKMAAGLSHRVFWLLCVEACMVPPCFPHYVHFMQLQITWCIG